MWQTKHTPIFSKICSFLTWLQPRYKFLRVTSLSSSSSSVLTSPCCVSSVCVDGRILYSAQKTQLLFKRPELKHLKTRDFKVPTQNAQNWSFITHFESAKFCSNRFTYAATGRDVYDGMFQNPKPRPTFITKATSNVCPRTFQGLLPAQCRIIDYTVLCKIYYQHLAI